MIINIIINKQQGIYHALSICYDYQVSLINNNKTFFVMFSILSSSHMPRLIEKKFINLRVDCKNGHNTLQIFPSRSGVHFRLV